MVRISVCAVAVLSLGAISVAGAATDQSGRTGASCRGAVVWQKARQRVGRVITVKGPVANTTFASWSTGSPTFLDIGVPYPDPRRVKVVIWIENRASFGRPERRYRGHTICVRGLVELYDDVPEIVARSSNQIAIAR